MIDLKAYLQEVLDTEHLGIVGELATKMYRKAIERVIKEIELEEEKEKIAKRRKANEL
jgi:hypothetical protein